MSDLSAKNKKNILLALAITAVVCAFGAMLSPLMAVVFYLGMMLCIGVVFAAEERTAVSYGSVLFSVAAIGACALLLLKLGLSVNTSLSSAIFAVSGVFAAVTTMLAYKHKARNVTVMVTGAVVLVAMWAGSFCLLVYEACGGVSGELIAEYFGKMYSESVELMATMPQMDEKMLNLLRGQQQAYITSVCRMILGFSIAAAEVVVFLLILCMRKIFEKLGHMPNFESLLEFRMDRVGAVVFIATSLMSFFQIGYMLDFVTYTVYLALTVPFSLAGIGAANALLSAFGMKKGWRIALIILLLSSMCMGVLSFVGAWDSFVDYRGKLKLYKERKNSEKENKEDREDDTDLK